MSARLTRLMYNTWNMSDLHWGQCLKAVHYTEWSSAAFRMPTSPHSYNQTCLHPVMPTTALAHYPLWPPPACPLPIMATMTIKLHARYPPFPLPPAGPLHYFTMTLGAWFRNVHYVQFSNRAITIYLTTDSNALMWSIPQYHTHFLAMSSHATRKKDNISIRYSYNRTPRKNGSLPGEVSNHCSENPWPTS